jgi:hypothetical protein
MTPKRFTTLARLLWTARRAEKDAKAAHDPAAEATAARRANRLQDIILNTPIRR